MTSQRPVSEQFNLQQKSGSNSQYRQSADLSHLGQQQQPNHRGSRPTSEIFAANANAYHSPEAEAIDKWFEDLQHYEQTLEEMAAASLDQNFKEELGALEQWFRVLSEAERTAALYSLLQHSTQVQIRFFITVLQQMARSDPMGALLSPANPEKDIMQAQLAKAEVEAKLAGISLKSPTSPTYPRSRLYDRHSGIEFLSPEAAIYSDPAAALAQQRARLQANTTSRTSSIYSSRPKSMVSESDQTVWNPGTPNGNNGNNKERTSNGRPKSADLSAAVPWTPGNFPLRSPRPGTGAFDGGELSPLVGGSWASMVSTPVVPMFAENKKVSGADAEMVTKKLTNWSISNSSGNRVVLESDVKKFRRNHGKGQSGVPATVHEEKYGSNQTNIVLSMVDADGNLRSPQQSPLPSPKPISSRQGSRPSSPNPNPGGLYPMHPWATAGGGKQTHLTPPGVGGHYVDENNSGEVGYLSDHSDASHNANSQKGHGKSKKKQNDDTVDFNLLNDIPQWLRSLRLHKYTPMFEGMKWQEIIELDDLALEQKGVAALGARRKMLKEFDKVKIAMKEKNNAA